jgi:hypothetical protein
MGKQWKHPQLGDFEYSKDDDAWVDSQKLPAFEVFTWELEEDERSDSFEIMFLSESGDEPSATAVKIALAVVANQKKLADLVPSTLWEEFNGRGSKSGMWWSGDMKEVAAGFGYDDRPCPKGPHDLLSAMRFARVIIREDVHDYGGPLAELIFAAVFEEEHGIGILTDGSKIVGTGYSHDATPFESE